MSVNEVTTHKKDRTFDCKSIQIELKTDYLQATSKSKRSENYMIA